MPDLDIGRPPDQPPAPTPVLGDRPGALDQDSGLFQQTGVRPGIVRNLVTALILGVAVAGMVWLFARPREAETSQSLSLSARASGPAPRVGKQAPDFRVLQLDGTTAHLSDFRGHPVWLSFWATWCPPCRSESPEIEQAYREYTDAGLVVLAIDLGEVPAAVQSYVQKAGLTYLVGLDQSTQIGALYHVAGLPNHFFVDSDGILRDWRVGPMGQDNITKSIATILPPGAPNQAAMAKPIK